MKLEDLKYYYSSRTGNIHIQESYKVSKKDIPGLIQELRKVYDRPYLKIPVLEERSDRSLELEWLAHNLLYRVGIAKARTAEVGFEYPQSCLLRLGYWILGNLGKIFLR